MGMLDILQVTPGLIALETFKIRAILWYILYSIYPAAANYTVSLLTYKNNLLHIGMNYFFSFQLVKAPLVVKSLTLFMLLCVCADACVTSFRLFLAGMNYLHRIKKKKKYLKQKLLKPDTNWERKKGITKILKRIDSPKG